MLILNACPLCLSDAEPVNYLLLHCQVSYQICVHFFQLLGIAFCLPRSILSILWSIWLERNKRIFQRKEGSISNLLDVIKLRAAWWMVGLSKFKAISASDLCRDWASVDSVLQHLASRPAVPWSRLAIGLLKLNFDGSCMREVGIAGYEGVIRNDSGLLYSLLLDQFEMDL